MTQPFPVYVRPQAEENRFSFERERITLNGRLYGLVMRNYTDLEMNEAVLGDIEFMMCYGRLADSRVWKYLEMMSSLRAVTIFSPVPRDVEVLREHCPRIEALDLMCEYWQCDSDLSAFTQLESLSIRGKHWMTMYEQSAAFLAKMRNLYLENASASQLPTNMEHLDELEVGITNQTECERLVKMMKDIGVRAVNVRVKGSGIDVSGLINSGVAEIEIVAEKSILEVLKLNDIRIPKGLLLHETNLTPTEPEEIRFEARTVSRFKGERLGEYVSSLRSDMIRDVYGEGRNIRRKLLSKTLLLGAGEDYRFIEEEMKSAVVQDTVERLTLLGNHASNNLEQIGMVFPSLRELYITGNAKPRVIRGILKSTGKDCIVTALMDEFKGEFSDDELARFRVTLDCGLGYERDLSQRECDSIVGLKCGSHSGVLDELKRYKNLKVLILEVTSVKEQNYEAVEQCLYYFDLDHDVFFMNIEGIDTDEMYDKWDDVVAADKEMENMISNISRRFKKIQSKVKYDKYMHVDDEQIILKPWIGYDDEIYDDDWKIAEDRQLMVTNGSGEGEYDGGNFRNNYLEIRGDKFPTISSNINGANSVIWVRCAEGRIDSSLYAWKTSMWPVELVGCEVPWDYYFEYFESVFTADYFVGERF